MSIKIDVFSDYVCPYCLLIEGVLAEAHGKADVYKDRVFRAFFQEDQDIGSLSVLGALADEVGLDKSQFLVALGEGKYTDRHEVLLERAQDLGVQSVPSLYVGGELIQAVFEPLALRRYLMEQHKVVSITQVNA